MRIGYLIPGLSGSVGNGGGTEGDRMDDYVSGKLTEYSSNIASVNSYAFYYYSYIQSLSLSSATRINQYAFYRCKSLQSIYIPEVTYIDINAFEQCTALINIVLPKTTTVGSSAFSNCSALEAVYMPLIRTISSHSFSYCPNLGTVEIGGTSVCSLMSSNAFSNTKIASGTGFVYVPDDLVESYKIASGWSTYANQIKPISEKPEV